MHQILYAVKEDGYGNLQNIYICIWRWHSVMLDNLHNLNKLGSVSIMKQSSLGFQFLIANY
jgi:hypothetical protein